jgi:hypothetical protein
MWNMRCKVFRIMAEAIGMSSYSSTTCLSHSFKFQSSKWFHILRVSLAKDCPPYVLLSPCVLYILPSRPSWYHSPDITKWETYYGAGMTASEHGFLPPHPRRFRGFHGCYFSHCGLLGCDIVQYCRRIPKFRRNVLTPSSVLKCNLLLPAQSFLASCPAGPTIIFFCLTALTGSRGCSLEQRRTHIERLYWRDTQIHRRRGGDGARTGPIGLMNSSHFHLPPET